MSHVQGRSYACIFGLLERFISTKTLEMAIRYGLGDQVALEGLVRFSDEEIKHQELFRRIEAALGDEDARRLRAGRGRQRSRARGVGQVEPGPCWRMTCHVELFTQVHYRESIERDEELSDLYRDVFRFHWLEECQHAVMDEIEWCREDRTLSPEARDAGGRRSDRAHQRTRPSAAGTIGGRRRLLHAPLRSHLHAGRAARDPRDCAARLSLAVHRVRLPAPAPHEAARRHGHAAADAEDSRRSRADHRLLSGC